MSPRVRAAGDTHPGLQRDQNEDRFFFDDKAGLYCVDRRRRRPRAGERAAAIAADVLRTSLDGRMADETRLRAAFSRANDAIYDAASRDAALRGMACVATLAAVADGRVRFAHVGDTRLYKIHDGAHREADARSVAGRRARGRGGADRDRSDAPPAPQRDLPRPRIAAAGQGDCGRRRDRRSRRSSPTRHSSSAATGCRIRSPPGRSAASSRASPGRRRWRCRSSSPPPTTRAGRTT